MQTFLVQLSKILLYIYDCGVICFLITVIDSYNIVFDSLVFAAT